MQYLLLALIVAGLAYATYRLVRASANRPRPRVIGPGEPGEDNGGISGFARLAIANLPVLLVLANPTGSSLRWLWVVAAVLAAGWTAFALWETRRSGG